MCVVYVKMYVLQTRQEQYCTVILECPIVFWQVYITMTMYEAAHTFLS